MRSCGIDPAAVNSTGYARIRSPTDARQHRASSVLGAQAHSGARAVVLALKTSSTDSPSAAARRNATATEGTSRPVSIALTSVRETPLFSASVACDQSRRRRDCASRLPCDRIMAKVSHDHIMSVNLAPAVWLLTVGTLAGIFALMFSFLFQTFTLGRVLPGPIAPAVVIFA